MLGPAALRAQLPNNHHGYSPLAVCPFILGNEFCERLAYYGYGAGSRAGPCPCRTRSIREPCLLQGGHARHSLLVPSRSPAFPTPPVPLLTARRLSTNLILYLTRVMGEESGHAALQVSLFSGTCYLTPLLGAWLADSMWGRYKTIMVFSLIYFLVRWGARRSKAWACGPARVGLGRRGQHPAYDRSRPSSAALCRAV